MRNCKIYTIHLILLGWANKEIEMRTCSMHGKIINVHTILVKELDYLADHSTEMKLIRKWILN
jgi:hypothetical protein